MPVTVTKDLSATVTVALRALSRRRVLVGVPAANNSRPDGQIGNAALAYIHSFGAPEANIPPRPFMEPGITAAQPAINTAFQYAAKAALNGDMQKCDANLDIAGIKAANSIHAVIQAGIPPPLKPATVAARRRRSAGSSYRRQASVASDTTPLIDTGELLKSLTYVVEKN
jgi:hypothetical protein